MAGARDDDSAQAVSRCEDGLGRRRALAFIVSEIEAFNDLIAARCEG
jgi:hypothetical protein